MKKIVLVLFVIITQLLQAQDKSTLADLPLITSSVISDKKTFILYVSGDGGWNTFNKNLVAKLVSRGYSVVTIDSKKYFWNGRTPDEFAETVARIAKYYLKTWGKKNFLLVGYSFGADVAAFVPARLPSEIKEKLQYTILVSPALSTDYEVRIMDMLWANNTVLRKYSIKAELKKFTSPALCIFGTEEDNQLKNELPANPMIHRKDIAGTHDFDDDYEMVAIAITENLDTN